MELLAPTNPRLTKSIGLWDRTPVWVMARIDPGKDGQTISTITREFSVRGVNYQVSVNAATMTEGGVTQHVFPGYREQTVERVLRKLAAKEKAWSLESGKVVSIQLRIFEIWDELRQTKHTLNYDEIIEAIEIMAGTIVTVRRIDHDRDGDPYETMLKAPIYPVFKKRRSLKAEKQEQTMIYVQMNEMIADSIKSLDFHDVNYTMLIGLKPVARWAYTWLVHSLIFENGEDDRVRSVSARMIQRECGMDLAPRTRAVFARIGEAIQDLVKEGVLENVEEESVLEPSAGGRPKKVDVIFRMTVSDRFYREVVQSKDVMGDNVHKFVAESGGKRPTDGWARRVVSKKKEAADAAASQPVLNLVPMGS
jgi:hypothetical protein